MSFDVEKVNSLLKSEEFVNKLKANLSDEGIIKLFNDEGIKLEKKDVQDFKKILSGLYEMSDENLDASGGKAIFTDLKANLASGKVSFKSGSRDIGKGLGTIAGGIVKGVGTTVWGVVQIPLSIVYDVGKGLYDGGKEGLGVGK